jgi:surface antigen
MNPAIIFGAVSFRKEISVVLITLGAIISLPIVALVASSEYSKDKTSTVALYTGPISVTDTYDFGYCTYWVALRREQTGHPIPDNWGNANTWAYYAETTGYRVDHVPEVGAIMQTTAGPLGHVAYVESVDPVDGSWTISEMNFKGWDVSDIRALTAVDALSYNFIH